MTLDRSLSKSMRLLIFGCSGQVASEISRRLPMNVRAFFLSRRDVDLLQPKSCADAVLSAQVDAVINAAAWTAVDLAEAEHSQVMMVNAFAPAAIAEACAARGFPFLHVSTDYVFSGKGVAPFGPDDPIAPVNAYGRSKALGEEGVRAAGGAHMILRTSWVFSAHGKNFVKSIVAAGGRYPQLRVVDDQVGGPTSAASIADALLFIAFRMCQGLNGGTFHFSGAPDVSWADFAEEIVSTAKLSCTVERVPSSEYATTAERPLNSRLDCSTLSHFGLSRPDWRSDMRDVLRDIGVNHA